MNLSAEQCEFSWPLTLLPSSNGPNVLLHTLGEDALLVILDDSYNLK